MTETRAGRHRPPRASRKIWPIAAVAAVCVIAGGATAWGLNRGDSHPKGAPATTSSSSGPATSTDSSADQNSGSPTPASSSNSPTTDAAALQAVAACRSTISTGQAMVAAADKNYADWSGHVYAQLDVDRGKITVAQGKVIWDRTKKAGPADLKAYDTAKKAWDAADQQACDHLKSSTDVPQSTVTACSARSSAMKNVIKLAAPVYAGWKGHQEQMTHTQEKSTDPNAYFTEWFGRVHNAEQPLAAYKSARDAYNKTAACPAAT